MASPQPVAISRVYTVEMVMGFVDQLREAKCCRPLLYYRKIGPDRVEVDQSQALLPPRNATVPKPEKIGKGMHADRKKKRGWIIKKGMFVGPHAGMGK